MAILKDLEVGISVGDHGLPEYDEGKHQITALRSLSESYQHFSLRLMVSNAKSFLMDTTSRTQSQGLKSCLSYEPRVGTGRSTVSCDAMVKHGRRDHFNSERLLLVCLTGS